MKKVAVTLGLLGLGLSLLMGASTPLDFLLYR
jgi:hypothetical protein